MKKTDRVLQVLEELIEKGILTIEALRDSISISKEELKYILQDLEFLDMVHIDKGRVYLSSQTYSLLFDAVIASKGLERYLERHLGNRVVKEIRTIPGTLVPILLLRAARPYFGLILRDLIKKGEIRIDKNKLDFLLEYFSSRRLDYAPLGDWEDIGFEPEEFYDLWIFLNRELSRRVRISPYLSRLTTPKKLNAKSKIRKNATSPPSISTPHISSEEGIFGIPEGSLKMLFGISEEDQGLTQTVRVNASVPSNIRKIREMKISLPKMSLFIQEYKSKTKGLVIMIYDNALKWEFTGEKIKVPTMFLLEDGIYIDEQTARRFTDLEISNQVRYLEDCVKISEKL